MPVFGSFPCPFPCSSSCPLPCPFPCPSPCLFPCPFEMIKIAIFELILRQNSPSPPGVGTSANDITAWL